MPSTLGDTRRVGPYEIIETLGQGAMGEVFVARDSRLSRNVAIKIISDETSDPGRRKRFIQEARSASALNHPNIVTVHDFGTADGISYIVSELVEGESLRTVLRRGSLSFRKLLDLAVQIADALAAAHEAGIVHRDLKPENIMITAGGRVKLLDFGLAKPLTGSNPESTVDENLTEPGFVVGTVAYMSPEQARGSVATIQSDQLSFGVILHEMATGNHPFKRETPMETLLAIANFQRPPFTPGPVSFRMLVERTLSVVPEKRYAHTTEIAERLRKIQHDLPEDQASAPASIRWWRYISPRMVTYALAGLALLVFGVFVAARSLTSTVGDAPEPRFAPFATESEVIEDPAWSPKGHVVAYAAEIEGTRQICVRSEHATSFAQVTTSTDDCSHPFWSTDGSRLYYLSRGALWSVSSTGGTPERIQENVQGAAVSPAGQLAIVRDGSVLISGKRLPFGSGVQAVGFSPDGSQVAASSAAALWTMRVGGGTARRLFAQLPSFNGFSWMPDSRRMVISSGHLWLGDTAKDTLRHITSGTGSERMPAVSPEGASISFAAVSAHSGIVFGDLEKGAAPVPSVAAFDETWPAWAPGRQDYAYVARNENNHDVRLRVPGSPWERTIATVPSVSQLAFGPTALSLASVQSGSIVITPLSGSASFKLASSNEAQSAPAWSPDGNWLAYFTTQNGRHVLARSLVGSTKSGPTVIREIYGNSLAWSPDNDWIACGGCGPGVELVSPDGSKCMNAGTGDWRELTWVSGKHMLAGVKRLPSGLTIATLNLETGEESNRLPLPGVHSVKGLTVAPDGRTVVTSTTHYESRLWMLSGFGRGQ
jgi:serine/threonine protein kinase